MNECTPDAAGLAEIADVMRLLAGAATPSSEPTFLRTLVGGTLDWSLMSPFPAQPEADRAAGDALLQRLRKVLRDHVDPETIDVEARLPDGYKALLRQHGLLGLRLPEEVGGADLSYANLVRVIQLVGSWCGPMAMSLSVHNAIGAPVFVGAVTDDAARARFLRLLADGALSGLAATETHGAANIIYQTVARPDADGSHYVLSGTKVFIGNGPIADVLVVPVTTFTRDAAGKEIPEVSAFMVETSSPGFSVESAQRYMGLRGLANGMLRFDNVRVPRENMIGAPGEGLRLVMEETPRGKLFTPAICLAVAQLCLRWSREFVHRRYMARPLSCFDLTRDHLARTGADIFAISSMLEWTVNRVDEGRLDVGMELDAIKVQSSDLAWSAVDATMQLLAGQGYETAGSKADRGENTSPVERFHRDVRVHRIFGTTNELIGMTLGQRVLLPFAGLFAGGKVDRAGVKAARARLKEPAGTPPDASGLSDANRAHLEFLRTAAARLAAAGLRQTVKAKGVAGALDRQTMLLALGRAAADLFTMATCLGAAQAAAGTSRADLAQSLADLWCTHARRRFEAVLRAAPHDDRAVTAPLAAKLADASSDWLMEGTME